MVGSRIPGPLGLNPDVGNWSDAATTRGRSARPGPIGLGTSIHSVWEEPAAIEDLCDCYRNRIMESYERMTSAEINIVSMDIEGYEYLFDLCHERVVGVLGFSYESTQTRDKQYMSGFLGRVRSKKQLASLTPTQQTASAKSYRRRFMDKFGTKYDRGHFISLRQGGVYDINLFPQRTDINCGWIEEWRDFERECVANPGSFCFVRPIYDDETWVPFELEYGIVRNGTERSRTFANRVGGE